jgi:dipeptidyl aminopeptidase/acylaminoacyl peptidase
MFWAPKSAKVKETPILVFLHSWSGDYRQNNFAWHSEAVKRSWIYLHPNFRGPNASPKACGSQFARQDIIDAIDATIQKWKVDQTRIYLAGTSGGGHMSMLMAGYYPRRFSAVSAWVGISDLAAWYRFHVKDGRIGNYAQMLSRSCEGAPGSTKIIDARYRSRSPIFHLHQVGDLPIEICAGVKDGHSGSVPIYQSLKAFNVIAKSNGHKRITQSEMDQLWNDGQLAGPLKSDRVTDKTYGREIRLRRSAGPSRVTIFDGGHEGFAHAACEWLAKHTRKTAAPKS